MAKKVKTSKVSKPAPKIGKKAQLQPKAKIL
jgi:hypothetical protein